MSRVLSISMTNVQCINMATSEQNTSDDQLVKLGFVEEDVDPRLLRSHFFPSKIGGKPSWLLLDNLPNPEELQCNICQGPLTFLMQVYAPISSKDDAFHRTLFMFVCTQASCLRKNDATSFKMLRSQLPLVNSFYSEEPPNENLEADADMSCYPHAERYQKVCQVCGSKAPKKCSKCKKTSYCSKQHQVLDWKAGHKKTCSETVGTTMNQGVHHSVGESDPVHGVLFKEFDLVTEDEPDKAVPRCTKNEEERLEDFQELMKSTRSQGLAGKFKVEDLEGSAASETEDDKVFFKFKQRIEIEPTQVLRYSRGGEPLWVSAFHKSTPEDIPPCTCGSKREFEFQVMPQLLNYLNVDSLETSLDWGTLCVYTCAESCTIGNTYVPECVWKQDFHGESDCPKLP